jgi:hypothetical protein
MLSNSLAGAATLPGGEKCVLETGTKSANGVGLKSGGVPSVALCFSLVRAFRLALAWFLQE